LFYQILPSIIFILAIFASLLVVLRRLPEAAEIQRKQGPNMPVTEKLAGKGLPAQAVSKLRPILEHWTKRVWNFILEAKDLKPGSLPGYKFRKIFGRRLRHQPQPLRQTTPPLTTAEVKDEKYYLEIIKKEPKNLANYDSLGKYYLDTQNYGDAKDIYLYLTNHEATNSDYHARLAYSFYQLEQYDKAAEHYKKSLALDSAQPTRYYNLGLSLEAAGKLPEAIKAFEQARTLEPDNYKFYIGLSQIYDKTGDKDKAKEMAALAKQKEGLHISKKVKVGG